MLTATRVTLLLTGFVLSALLSGSAGAITPSVVFEMRTEVVADGKPKRSDVQFGGLVIQISGKYVSALVPRFIVDLQHPSNFYQDAAQMVRLVAKERDGQSQVPAQLVWLPRWDAKGEWAIVRFKSTDETQYDLIRPATKLGDRETEVQLRFGTNNLFKDHELTAKKRSLTRNDYCFKDPDINAFSEGDDSKNYVPYGTAILNKAGELIGCCLPTGFIDAFVALKASLQAWGDVTAAAEGIDADGRAAADSKRLVGLGTLLAGLYTGGIATILGGVAGIATADASLRTPAGALRKTAEANAESAKAKFKETLQTMLLGFEPWSEAGATLPTRWWDERCYASFDLPRVPGDEWKFELADCAGSRARFSSEKLGLTGEYQFLFGVWTHDKALEAARKTIKSRKAPGEEVTYTEETVRLSRPEDERITEWVQWNITVIKDKQVVSRGVAIAGILRNSVWLFDVRGQDSDSAERKARLFANSLTLYKVKFRVWFISGDFTSLAKVDTGEWGGPEIKVQVYKDEKLVCAVPKKQDDVKPVWNCYMDFEYTAGDWFMLKIYEEDSGGDVDCFTLTTWIDSEKAGWAINLFDRLEEKQAAGDGDLDGTYGDKTFTFSLDVRTNAHHRQLAWK